MTRRNPRTDPAWGDHLVSHGYPRHVSRVDSRGVCYTGGNGRASMCTLDEWREWAAGARVVRRPKPQLGTIAARDADDCTGGPVIDGTIWLHGHPDPDEARRIADDETAEAESARWPAAEWRAGLVEHCHARTIPSLDEQGDRCSAVVLSAPGRGAYPVTLITLERR